MELSRNYTNFTSQLNEGFSLSIIIMNKTIQFNPLKYPIYVMAKAIGPACNLRCSYCYYLDKKSLSPQNSSNRMSIDTLEKFTEQYINAQPINQVLFTWHGGEPLLMSIDYYQKAIQFQKIYGRNKQIDNVLQTNGTLLTDEWCQFFKENNFLIGISIDGPRELHDSYRVDKGGQGTFERVIRGLRLLQKHGVDYNVLTTINRTNAEYPLEVYRFLRDEARTSWIQFIPVVERINEGGRTLYQEGT